jgi:hypothetical protein
MLSIVRGIIKVIRIIKKVLQHGILLPHALMLSLVEKIENGVPGESPKTKLPIRT